MIMIWKYIYIYTKEYHVVLDDLSIAGEPAGPITHNSHQLYYINIINIGMRDLVY